MMCLPRFQRLSSLSSRPRRCNPPCRSKGPALQIQDPSCSSFAQGCASQSHSSLPPRPKDKGERHHDLWFQATPFTRNRALDATMAFLLFFRPFQPNIITGRRMKTSTQASHTMSPTSNLIASASLESTAMFDS
ncbi:hypothetical protein BJ508DRAFT_66346 [Ascobolus immersus RN42]|uniref:Uncharacterized protein n=1 Tax=Ascobolus immersus RN42 TaxID=1160509 RepID=A0A3N4IBL2_ASCIM|nr:hypothetical protein BJ508DRAFT_66346 [Ascobolus immersus RN42]